MAQVEIPVSHGKLEGILQTGADDAPLAAIVCHPHPLHGGTMHNKVVFNAAKALGSFGWPVLRFNFRGVGASTGGYGNFVGEQEDVLAALDFLGYERVVIAGFSFGSVVGLNVGAQDPRAVALCGLGLPVALQDRPLDAIQSSAKPKLFVSGDRDEFGPLELLRPWFDEAAEPKELCIVPDADHFFTGQTEAMKEAIVGYFSRFDG